MPWAAIDPYGAIGRPQPSYHEPDPTNGQPAPPLTIYDILRALIRASHGAFADANEQQQAENLITQLESAGVFGTVGDIVKTEGGDK